jgi:hypothetical protein
MFGSWAGNARYTLLLCNFFRPWTPLSELGALRTSVLV